MPDPWTTLRAAMPVAANWAYFDHAAVAPLPRPAVDALREWAEDVANNGDVNWPQWRKRVEDVRRMAAELLNADSDEIALIRNTTEGITLIAEGIRWRPGDNVVVPAAEFPSNLYPWLNLRDRGVEVRVVDSDDRLAEALDVNRIADAVDERTRVVAVSWVGYLTGWRNDLDELAGIAHAKGALLVVDAIQGLGVFPLDVKKTPVDFLAADGHKWLLGPEGAGVLFVRRELLDELRPLGVGWNSVKNAADFGRTLSTSRGFSEISGMWAGLDLKESAGRYEGGSYGMGNLAALGASLELLRNIPGISENPWDVNLLAERLIDVTNRLCERLEEIEAEVSSCRDEGRTSGIVSFVLPGRDPQAVRQECRQQGVIVNCRGGAVRVSPHVYTDETDIERLLAALAP